MSMCGMAAGTGALHGFIGAPNVHLVALSRGAGPRRHWRTCNKVGIYLLSPLTFLCFLLVFHLSIPAYIRPFLVSSFAHSPFRSKLRRIFRPIFAVPRHFVRAFSSIAWFSILKGRVGGTKQQQWHRNARWLLFLRPTPPLHRALSVMFYERKGMYTNVYWEGKMCMMCLQLC